MSHLRWDPLLGTYNMIAANRQHRPHLPQGQCPFCPGSGQVPDDYEVLVYPNDFPALSADPEIVEQQGNDLYHTAPAYGKCEVILYSPDHYKGLGQLPQDQVLKLVKTWAARYADLSEDEQVKYVFPFENRGEEVGVTIHHPHGQLYAYPFIPLRILTELTNARNYFEQHGRSLFDAMMEAELKDGRRIIAENDHFVAFIPWFSDYPYGVYILSKAGGELQDMRETQHKALAAVLRMVTGAMDTLFNKPFPYMMCLYQAPVNVAAFNDSSNYYPFHIKFFPVLRGENRIKWMASSETGAWAAANTLLVEDTALQLKQAIKSYI